MGYIFNYSDALIYEKHLKQPGVRRITELENNLMLRMLRPLRGKRLLDIGCGTGACLTSFLDAGLDITGLEPSHYMTEIALKKLGHRVELYQGLAENLPFEDNSFNYACLIKTLEFVENPLKAIEEACRVAKDRVFIGIINRHSLKASGMRIKRLFMQTFYNEARFFSIWEIKSLIRSVSGNMPISWRTICQMPRLFQTVENIRAIQFSPFGAYAGIVITLVPTFRMRSLEIPCEADCPKETVAGLAKITRRSAENGSMSV